MRISTLIFLVCAVGCAVGLAQDFQEADDKRSKYRSPRGPVIPNRTLKNQLKPAPSSTTTEAPPPVDAAEGEYYDDAAYDEALGAEEPKETTTTSTEPPKKGIRGGVVRPFRSNEDLIEALKRRRAQISSERAISTHAPHTTSTTTEPTKGPGNRQSKNLSNNRKFSRSDKQVTSSEAPEAVEEPTQRTNRLFAGRGRRI
ncbi:Hypothetical protein NTJ_15205 [Nesidiocoris tenuis]|uniref:Secreted protein n=1 Tax=Nesidiocoris tenuis TaxID=355587 RepID=A0ABN7BDD9_9HEMI|nr:Hypothetical protein NTJ_15205 [Nesidiocoris tenuis]